MAYAEIGRYDAATAFQQAAIDAAMLLGGFNLVPGLSINLTLYQQGIPCRAPWPDDAAVFYPNSLNYGESGLAFSGERSH